ncbi:MAG TPA: hypothetical protein VN742_09245 [Candidatus Binataceae bacterium]|nr:hypothetical protein [Candidatus Binataceae bacterium]
MIDLLRQRLMRGHVILLSPADHSSARAAAKVIGVDEERKILIFTETSHKVSDFPLGKKKCPATSLQPGIMSQNEKEMLTCWVAA